MADLYLVRHGQASFGAVNYDKLSALGEEQSRLLGRWFAQCGLAADAIAHGAPERQRETARLCMAECHGPGRHDWLDLDGLGEFDHSNVIERHSPALAAHEALRAYIEASDDPRRTYQALYADAVRRWTGGEHDDEYRESWPAFRERVLGGLERLVRLSARNVIAFTSGGPITAVLQHATGLPDTLAFSLNWPLVNTGITRLRFSARTGTLTLATYNSHPHLDATSDVATVTYR